MTIGSMLDDVVAGCEFLSEDDTEQQNAGLAPGYLYCEENGMPKYWLDFTGTISDNLVLHCWFRSGDPTYYEQCFVLDLSTAEVAEGGLQIRQVHNLQDADCSDWFKGLTLQFYLDAAVMTVERDEKTLAGGAEDNILDGTYVMVPTGVSSDGAEKTCHIRPLEEGPYQPEELGQWVQFYYFRNNGVFLSGLELTENPDGTVTVRLSEGEREDDSAEPEISEAYTVDLYGEGKNDATGERVSLMK